jgi:ABC-2 type transport system ATP-binding protein
MQAKEPRLIATQRLTRRFGDFTAVDSLTLQVPPGEVFGFLGPNGAGKTTVIRMLASLISPSEGDAHVAGFDVRKQGHQIRQVVGILTEAPGLYRKLSARENLRFYAKLYGVSNPDRQADAMLQRLQMEDSKDIPVGRFSKGMAQKIAIARALIHDPQLVFLDEPTSGLDPEASFLVREFIASLKSQGKTVFLCTHRLEEAERLCDRVAVFRRKILAIDTPQGLRRSRFGSRVVIELARRHDPLLGAARSLPFVSAVQWRNTPSEAPELVVTLSNPREQNPLLLRTLISNGAEIRFVREEQASLEQAYLSLTGSLKLD